MASPRRTYQSSSVLAVEGSNAKGPIPTIPFGLSMRMRVVYIGSPNTGDLSPYLHCYSASLITLMNRYEPRTNYHNPPTNYHDPPMNHYHYQFINITCIFQNHVFYCLGLLNTWSGIKEHSLTNPLHKQATTKVNCHR